MCFDSAASAEDLQNLKSVVDGYCPVLDQFNCATPAQIDIVAPTAAQGGN
jgi:hypothetical protein